MYYKKYSIGHSHIDKENRYKVEKVQLEMEQLSRTETFSREKPKQEGSLCRLMIKCVGNRLY